MFTRLSRTVSRKCSSVLATNKTILLDIIERQIKRQKANGKRQKCSGAEFVFVTLLPFAICLLPFDLPFLLHGRHVPCSGSHPALSLGYEDRKSVIVTGG